MLEGGIGHAAGGAAPSAEVDVEGAGEELMVDLIGSMVGAVRGGHGLSDLMPGRRPTRASARAVGGWVHHGEGGGGAMGGWRRHTGVEGGGDCGMRWETWGCG